jgi:hypothetical protein
MLVAMGMVLLGLGVTFLGIVEPTMYDVGIVVVFVGLVGVGVRLGDWLIRWRRSGHINLPSPA